MSLLAFLSQMLFTASTSAHELPRLHEHLPDNLFRYSPRAIEIEFIAPQQNGEGINMRIGFQSIADEVITLSASSSWAGVASDMVFQDLRATTFSGERLHLEKKSTHSWSVRSPREHWVNIYYSISPNKNEVSGSTHFRPIMNADFFHGIGQLFLLLPEDELSDLIKVDVQWTGFESLGWTTLQSVANQGPEVLGTSALLSSLFMAGDFHVNEYRTPYGDLRIAMQKSNWKFTREAFNDLTKKIVLQEREYFSIKKNKAAAPFLVSLINVAPEFTGISINGTSLHNSFALFANSNTMLYESAFGNPTTTLAFLIAHEMMHQWIGHELKTNEDNEILGYWFTEGFTDYLTLQLLYQAKIINLERYIDLLNHMLEEYWLSKKKNITNADIARDFWSDPVTNRVPYLRGFLIALKTDHSMRKVRVDSNKSTESRLKNMLQKMLAHSDGQAHHTAISNRSLFNNIEKKIGKPLTDSLRNSVYTGANVSISTQLLSPCIEMGTRELGLYDPGFNVDQTIAARRLTGVKINSRAFQLGLRNGQKLAKLSIGNNPKDKILVAIYQDNDTKKINYEYYPIGNPRPVLQAKIKDAASCPNIL